MHDNRENQTTTMAAEPVKGETEGAEPIEQKILAAEYMEEQKTEATDHVEQKLSTAKYVEEEKTETSDPLEQKSSTAAYVILKDASYPVKQEVSVSEKVTQTTETVECVEQQPLAAPVWRVRKRQLVAEHIFRLFQCILT